ncbi:MAG: chorismate synthase [Elusimicrobia bacterium]|nr:chorismate synthase [Elusimicrobiota bacterium]
MLRYLTAGESHGKALMGILEGFPSGMPIKEKYIALQLKRRRMVCGRSARQKIETDNLEIISGLYKGKTTGAPIGLLIHNKKIVSTLSQNSIPRPGHADFAAMLKYDITQSALIRERASARETCIRVGLGSFAMRFTELLGIKIKSRVTSLASSDLSENKKSIMAKIEEAAKMGETLGGIFEISAENLPIGLGSHNQLDRKISANIGRQLLSLNAIKGIEMGSGFKFAELRGSDSIDGFEIKNSELCRTSNMAGGIEGGITNGQTLILSCAVKAVPGIKKGINSINLKTGAKVLVCSDTSDITAVFAGAVIGEHLLALELTNHILEKFGGDSFNETKDRLFLWNKQIAKKLRKSAENSVRL